MRDVQSCSSLIFAQTGAVAYLTPIANPAIASRALGEADDLVRTAVTGPECFFARREIVDEYGWRHFGDMYADHEAVDHTGPEPLVAHYNNQYDVVHGAAVQYMRSGDRRWFDLMRDLARHVIDIDIYHTDRDRPAFNGGMFCHLTPWRILKVIWVLSGENSQLSARFGNTSVLELGSPIPGLLRTSDS